LGTVEGVVRLAAGASLPRYTLAEVGRTPDRPALPEGCPPPTEEDLTPVRLGDEGLSPVMVTATGNPEAFFAALPSERPPRERTVRIEACRLEPRLVSATRGDTLLVVNDSPYPFLPTFGRIPFMQALPRGEGRREVLGQGGVFPLTCGFAAPCGRSEVVVVYHPVHTVTDATGRFRLEGVPADQEIEIHAWHPLFEEAVATVRVAPGGTQHVELRIGPAARGAAPTPSVSEDEAHEEERERPEPPSDDGASDEGEGSEGD